MGSSGKREISFVILRSSFCFKMFCFPKCMNLSGALFQEGIPEENEDESDYEANDANVALDEKESVENVQPSVRKSRIHTPSIFSPFQSPKTSPKILSPKPDSVQSKNEATSVLRLLSTRMTDSAITTSLPASPVIGNEFSISSADSDCEVIVMTQTLHLLINPRCLLVKHFLYVLFTIQN